MVVINLSENKTSFGYELYKDIETNDYLVEIINILIFNYIQKLYKNNKTDFKDLNVNDALIFADILSNSKNKKHQDMAQQIISVLCFLYPNNTKINIYSKAVLDNIGNY